MKNISIIVGGSGQFGHILAKKLHKKKQVIITTRSISKSKKKIGSLKNIKIIKLNIQKKIEIEKLLIKFQPSEIFYFAGQSSPAISFKKPKDTYLSNYKGCKNFLEIIKKKKINCKFINSTSCDIFGNVKGKISLKTRKNPISPYGIAKLASFNITRKYREKYNLLNYNAIIFNTESIYRDKNFLIPKICMSAIKAYKIKKKNRLWESENI